MADFMEVSRDLTTVAKYDPGIFELKEFVSRVADSDSEKHYAYIEIGGRKVEMGTGILRTGQTVDISVHKYSSLVHRDLDDDIDYLQGDRLYDSIKKKLDEMLAQDNMIEAIVISTAGTVRESNLVSSHNLKKFIAIQFTERLHQEYGQRLRIRVYNDAEALIWGSLYFAQGKSFDGLIDVIVGTGFNILYAKVEDDKISVYKTFVDRIEVSEGVFIEDVIAGKFIEKYRHKYFPEFLYYISASNVKTLVDALVSLLSLPRDTTTIVFQGGIVENVPIYTEKFSKDYPLVANAKDLSGGKNINAYGAIYHDLFEFTSSQVGL